MSGPVLRVDSVGKRLGGRPVLKSASLSAEAGTVTALVGRNGEGKSTLLRIAAGWTAPDRGWVELDGVRSERPSAAALALAGLLYLPVDRSCLSPVFSLAQHLDALEARFGPRDRAPVLERLRIAELERVRTASLSGGERRRAELAFALLRAPRCALLDEPARGIDPRDAEFVARAIRALASDGCAVVVTGHEVEWMFALADEVVWIHAGCTRSLGPPDRARGNARFRQEYLGPRS